MKRLWILVLALLLCGCAAAPVSPTETSAPTVLTEEPWDAEGVLTELVLTIPGGNSYTDCMGFRDNILLWSCDGHMEGKRILELCLIDPAKRTMAASLEVEMPNPVTPQVYGNALYLCDPKTGTVLELDRSLQVTGEWTVPAASAEDAVWYAANRKLWEFSRKQPLKCLSLGEIYWSEDQTTQWTEIRRPYVKVVEHDRWGGIVSFSSQIGDDRKVYALDLTEGTVITPPQGYERYHRSGNVWLGVKNDTSPSYGICVGNGAMRKVTPIEGTLSLLPEGYLLERSPGDQYLRLYDREGRCISVCRLWETVDGYVDSLIWNDALGGYLIHYRPHFGGSRLLFWDIRKGSGSGDDLKIRSFPAADAVQEALRAEAAPLAERFGVSILVGTDCDLEQSACYMDGSVSYATDFDLVCNALDVLEQALERYPADFFQQLREDFLTELRILFVCFEQADETALPWSSAVLEDTAVLTFGVERMDEHAVQEALALLEERYHQWQTTQQNG